jgi:CheY-like chemotaxis protein
MARILLVEDDEMLRVLLKRLLERAGHTVTEASDGSFAVRILSGQSVPDPDLIITDILMSEADGFETIRHVRGQFPSARIVAMSGGTDQLTPDRLLEVANALGADRVLTKPFTSAVLLRAVSDLTVQPAC